jgi:hypothetical protein
MRYKLIYGFFAVFVSALMLMSTAIASAGPPIWINQATLSLADVLTSQDPENSGFGLTQAVVWEEWNGADWDIMLRYNPADGALGAWIPLVGTPAIIVAGTAQDEINPAVAVTNINPGTGVQEIHVVYQCANPAVPGTWDICHMWTPIPAIAWVGPVVLDTAVANDALDPAIVFTEDLNTQSGAPGMLVQFVWSEFNPAPGSLIYEIQYDAYYYDSALLPPTGYVGPSLIQGAATGAVGNCEFPEIASVDETLNAAATDFYFAIVWQETNAAGQINVWYNDGSTTTSPGAPGTVPTPGSLGQLNPVNVIGDSYHPDIAATQDFTPAGTAWGYYFQVNWVYQIWGPPVTYQIDTCYAVGPLPNLGAAAFIMTASAVGPVAWVLDNPTIAVKLFALGPTIYDVWMCWEDNNPAGPSPTDIWYCVGQYNGGVPGFGYTFGPAFVPYWQPVGSSEFNPELWNRNDSTRMFPPFTHLVYDMTQVTQEVEYIDP